MRDDLKLSLIVIAGTVVVLGLIVVLVQIFDKPSVLPVTEVLGREVNVVGTKDAATTIVEFSDFQCPACAVSFRPVSDLLRDYPADVYLEYRHFPLNIHPNAYPVAYAAEAAGKQGKFWEVHDWLFENQSVWEAATVDAEYFYAQFGENIGLNKEQFVQDYASDAVHQAVADDVARGNELGIKSTPTFYINGKKQVGGLSYEDWVKKLALPGIQTTVTPTTTPSEISLPTPIL